MGIILAVNFNSIDTCLLKINLRINLIASFQVTVNSQAIEGMAYHSTAHFIILYGLKFHLTRQE
jgi:hypothetical protein